LAVGGDVDLLDIVEVAVAVDLAQQVAARCGLAALRGAATVFAYCLQVG
jgi:hypothetical protein